MKVLFVAVSKTFTDVEMDHVNKKQLNGVERITGSSLMFDVSQASSVLADLQNYCHDRYISYNLYYFNEEPVMFASP